MADPSPSISTENLAGGLSITACVLLHYTRAKHRLEELCAAGFLRKAMVWPQQGRSQQRWTERIAGKSPGIGPRPSLGEGICLGHVRHAELAPLCGVVFCSQADLCGREGEDTAVASQSGRCQNASFVAHSCSVMLSYLRLAGF